MEEQPDRESPLVAVYRLALDEEPAQRPEASDRLDVYLLRPNAVWFCRLRWIVVVILATAGAAAGLGLPLHHTGVRLQPGWLLIAAGFVAVLNVAYLFLLPHDDAPGYVVRLKVHVWFQIVMDLVVLTAVIHFLGSVETPAVFMYLFHIILACIFFPPWQSLIVAMLSAGLYLSCLALESLGFLAASTVVLQTGFPDRRHLTGGFWVAHLGFTLMIAGVIWHLASQLAGAVRQRDQNLADANARLQASSEERAQHMLQTTHQLKAPFAAIHANAQLLLRGTCGTLPEAAREAVERIAARCAMVSQQVVDMLQLANLRSAGQAKHLLVDLDLAAVIQASISRFEPVASQRDIRIQADLNTCVVRAVEDHLKMLLDNLINNAINYSYPGGTVHVSCFRQPDGTTEVAIRDEGIGIAAGKLPKIFEDYYRTSEAVRHNKESTGLGLAIVRHAARLADIQVQVESGPGWGTRFTLTVPQQPFGSCR